jgi:hypothetical protein
MQAKFYSTGKLEIYNNQGQVVVEGKPDAKKGDFGFHPMMDWAVSLMKFKGDWPERPWQDQTVELMDEGNSARGR